MAREIYETAHANGMPVVHLIVRTLPSDPKTIAGDVRYRDSNPKHQIYLHMSAMPIEIEQAKRKAQYIAREQGVDYIWVDDPKGLLSD